MDASFDYFHWTDAELARAENTAGQFLVDNQIDITRVFASQCAILQGLIGILGRGALTLEQRLDCFARIAELADSLQKSANGFFELGSQPLVARMLSSHDSEAV